MNEEDRKKIQSVIDELSDFGAGGMGGRVMTDGDRDRLIENLKQVIGEKKYIVRRYHENRAMYEYFVSYQDKTLITEFGAGKEKEAYRFKLKQKAGFMRYALDTLDVFEVRKQGRGVDDYVDWEVHEIYE